MTCRVMSKGLRSHLESASTGQGQDNLSINNNCNQQKQCLNPQVHSNIQKF